MRIPTRGIVLLCVLAVLGTVVVLAGPWLLRGRVGTWMRDPRLLVKPAGLVPLHQAVPELQDCNACHDLDAPIPDEKCLACHEEIGSRQAAGNGYHGRDLEGACHDCHRDHDDGLIEFDRAAFNHARAAYKLEGRHARLACTSCHERPTGVSAQPLRMQYVGLPHAGCIDCHEDPHRGELTADGRICVDCHDQEGWTDRRLRFAHDRDSSFRLDGAHTGLPCAGCHPPPAGSERLADAQFTGIGTGCLDCHEDPHGRQFVPLACETCHTVESFQLERLLFRHDAVEAYRLEGEHAGVACESCHPPGSAAGEVVAYRGVSHDCATCHDDPHGGQFVDTACDTCHQERGFAGRNLLFRHEDLERYRLDGAHSRVACAKCHPPAPAATDVDVAVEPTTFRGVSHACDACHTDPHAGQFEGTACAGCHVTQSFRGGQSFEGVQGLAFDHAAVPGFPLTGAHVSVECAACHSPTGGADAVVRYQGTPTACVGCHEDPHAGSLAPRECTECHDTKGWRGEDLAFDHGASSRFPLDATHSPVACASCHADRVYRPTPSTCEGCHESAAAALQGVVPGGATADRREPDPHAGLVTCVECHDTSQSEMTRADVAARCATCHSARYTQLHFERMAHLETLAARAGAAPGAAAQRERVAGLTRLASHDYVLAERALAELVAALASER